MPLNPCTNADCLRNFDNLFNVIYAVPIKKKQNKKDMLAAVNSLSFRNIFNIYIPIQLHLCFALASFVYIANRADAYTFLKPNFK